MWPTANSTHPSPTKTVVNTLTLALTTPLIRARKHITFTSTQRPSTPASSIQHSIVLPGKSLCRENRNAGKSLLSISMTVDSRNQMNEDLPEGHVEGELTDLYVCCQCSIYCIVSGAMSGIIALKYAEDFVKYRYEYPFIGRQPNESVVSGRR
jgi:hypothetical protein